MEEVWKDISVGTPRQEVPLTPAFSFHQLHTATATAAGLTSINLQDFLAGVFEEANPAPTPGGAGRAAPASLGGPRTGGACVFPTSAGAGSGSPKMRLAKEQRPNASPTNRNGFDRRNKRMIKNRESAARSRARKQAYTNELEMEVNRLMNENNMLKRQRQELLEEMASGQNPVVPNRTLQRTLTAPF
ncbi:hypothetical protein Cni_G26960 [Canna indica]|uniref:BZIP domain-containing protein n=1 Tax=Canna indica TaxID=4628 RepID=A0AAQ3L734_9LILI|nr:hypothetical protein Cni_G26960 [Canna indica]